MKRPVIGSIGHVALTTPDLAAAVETARSITGLRTVTESDGAVDLTHGAPHHTLQYIAGDEASLHHVGLVAADAEALGEIRARAEERGDRIVSESPFDSNLTEGFVVEGPEGLLFEIYTGMPEGEQIDYPTTGVRPSRFGHVTVTLGDPVALRDFLVAVLDFRISDELAGGFFMRCNVDHHGIGIFPGDPGLHHYAWELAGIHELAGVADRLDEEGDSVLLGPVRHGAGSNLAVYFKDGAGIVVEYYCEMDRIYDEENYQPGEWNMEEFKWFSRWAPLLPEGWTDLAIGRVTADAVGV